MKPVGLSQYYDMIKNGEDPNIINSDSSSFTPIIHHMHDHDDFDWKNKVMDKYHDLKNNCAKHILVDIYFHSLPLDHDYKCRNMGMIKQDVDKMLQNKGMDATQYLTSCYEKTKAPLLNYIIRSIDEIGKRYLEDASQALAKAKNQNGAVQQSPEIKNPDSEEVASQLIDVKKYPEYEMFMKELTDTTKEKIVSDTVGIIKNKQDERGMKFNKPVDNTEVKNESAIVCGMDYLQKILWEHVDIIENNQEELLGIVIRESVLNQLDVVFKQSGQYVEDFHKKLWKNQGVLINESVKDLFIHE